MIELLSQILIDEGYPLKELSKETEKALKSVQTLNLNPYSRPHNPSIVPHQDHYLICFRSTKRQLLHRKRFNSKLVIAALDKEGKIIKGSDHIILPDSKTAEDPRIDIFNNTVYITFNELNEAGGRSIHRGEWDFDKNALVNIKVYSNRNGQFLEKNWVPFIGKVDNSQEPLYYYSFAKPSVISTQTDKEVSSIPMECTWDYGEIHGGSQAIEINGSMLTFFQSHLKVPHRKKRRHFYFMGALLFEKSYPFRPIKMTKRPLYFEDFYHSKHRTKKCIVYPSGLVSNGDGLTVSIGSGDNTSQLVVFNTDALLKLLSPIA